MAQLEASGAPPLVLYQMRMEDHQACNQHRLWSSGLPQPTCATLFVQSWLLVLSACVAYSNPQASASPGFSCMTLFLNYQRSGCWHLTFHSFYCVLRRLLFGDNCARSVSRWLSTRPLFVYTVSFVANSWRWWSPPPASLDSNVTRSNSSPEVMAPLGSAFAAFCT